MAKNNLVERLNREHPDYSARKEMWQRYWDFYAGGEQLRRNAGLYLVRRQKEPNDVYAERLSRVFYENYLGSCIDWYAATLFRSPPRIHFETPFPAVRDFYDDFVEDCDRRGGPLVELLRKTLIHSLVFREAYALIDFPRVEGKFATRAEEDATGKSRAYVVPFTPKEVINWKTDGRGALEWAVVKTKRTFQEAAEEGGLVSEEVWSYYDRERFRVYLQRRHEAGGRVIEDEDARLVDEGAHALAAVKEVPLVKMSLSEGLWLTNKAALLQLEHFNKSNALSWALHMGLFAMPVIYSERDWQQIVGEAYYIQLGSNDRFGWTEPEGKVFQIAAENLDRLKNEIYRVCYLMTQAAGNEPRHLGQSGESKRRDFAITHEVLRAYGATVKEFVRRLLIKIRAARRDEVEFEVGGLEQFDAPDFGEELENAIELQKLGISSPIFRREVQKRVALKYLEGSSKEIRAEVEREIDTAQRR